MEIPTFQHSVHFYSGWKMNIIFQVLWGDDDGKVEKIDRSSEIDFNIFSSQFRQLLIH